MRIKAVAMFSGGLDSILATKLMLEQGVDVRALSFASPFSIDGKEGQLTAIIAEKLGIPLKKVFMDEDYLEIVKNPKHGYGRYMNPCIDCRIYMLKKAKEYADEIGAAFIFTGEVLDERPMSQRRKALEIIEKEAGLVGKILRPLSAKHFPETEAERKGWVDRSRLLDLKGRSRKKQMELAKLFNINDYPHPSGGCLLTYKEFAAKVRDLIEHQSKLSFKDIMLLKVGRHFRFGENKIIVGRNEKENEQLLSLKDVKDVWLEASGCGSPITLLQGPVKDEAIELAASITAKYSDYQRTPVDIAVHKEGIQKTIKVDPITDEFLNTFRVKW
ncbi:MAG: hypothetical protein QXO32_06655 [Candidatus Bathyarchaeia archaeon]